MNTHTNLDTSPSSKTPILMPKLPIKGFSKLSKLEKIDF